MGRSLDCQSYMRQRDILVKNENHYCGSPAAFGRLRAFHIARSLRGRIWRQRHQQSTATTSYSATSRAGSSACTRTCTGTYTCTHTNAKPQRQLRHSGIPSYRGRRLDERFGRL